MTEWLNDQKIADVADTSNFNLIFIQQFHALEAVHKWTSLFHRREGGGSQIEEELMTSIMDGPFLI